MSVENEWPRGQKPVMASNKPCPGRQKRRQKRGQKRGHKVTKAELASQAAVNIVDAAIARNKAHNLLVEAIEIYRQVMAQQSA